MHSLFFYLSFFLMVVASLGIFVVLVKNRVEGANTGKKFHESFAADFVWTIIPIAMLFALALPSVL